MAKTRAQTRRENDKLPKIARTSQISKEKRAKTRNPKVSHGVKSCHVQLTNLSAATIKRMIGDIENGTTDDVTRNVANNQSRNLRPRPPPKIIEKAPRKPLNQIVALSQAALCTSKAIRIWDSLKKDQKMNDFKLKENDIVCARMTGHRPWPAKVEAFNRNGVLLMFYGTNEKGTVKRAEVIPFSLCKLMLEQYMKIPSTEVANKTLTYHLSFLKACREVACIQYV